MTEDGGAGDDGSGASQDPSSNDFLNNEGKASDPIQPDGVSGAAGPSGPPQRSGMSNGARIAIGCGVVSLLVLLGGCVAVVFGFNAVRDEIENSNVRLTDTAVTLDQFNRVENGQTLQQVEEIFGGPGVGDGPSAGADANSQTYIWSGENITDVASVTFRDGQVAAKYQLGLK